MEAYISSFVFCDTIQTQLTPNGPQQYQIVNPLQALTPVAVPGNFSFSIACSISGFDINNDHTIKISFLDPEGNTCAIPIDNFKFNAHDFQTDPVASSVANISLNIDLRNVVLKYVGKYTARVVFDDNIIGNFFIEVIKQKDTI